MAVITAKSWVLGGISVIKGGKADWVRHVSLDQGHVQAPTIPFSMRHLMAESKGFIKALPGHHPVDLVDAGNQAPRAGRLACLAGVLLRCTPYGASTGWPITSNPKRMPRYQESAGKRLRARAASRQGS